MMEIDVARHQRERIVRAGEFFLVNEPAISTARNEIEWNDLEQLPEWFHWGKERIYHLALTAGVVFVLPSVRLWIKSTQIHAVQELIGKSVYEFLIKYTYKEVAPVDQIIFDDMEKTLAETGAAVILSGIREKYRPWIVSKLPDASGTLSEKLATELLNHTLYAIENAEKLTGSSTQSNEEKQ